MKKSDKKIRQIIFHNNKIVEEKGIKAGIKLRLR
jgi:hypothetical protein